MSSLAISQPTTTLLALVERAARENRDKTTSAKDMLTKLDFSTSCKDVQDEFEKSYLDNIQPGSSTAAILEKTKIKSRYRPETFVLTGGSFRIPSETSAVAIPLVKAGNPRIQYYDPSRVASSVDWDVGSVIYLAGDSSLMSDGRGNTSFVFLLFTLKTDT